MSGYAEDAFEKSLPENQQFAFLPKPFTLSQLVAAVKETMAPHEQPRVVRAPRRQERPVMRCAANAERKFAASPRPRAAAAMPAYQLHF